MTQYFALYGFTRRKDGLRVSPQGVDAETCLLFHAGGESAAVVSPINPRNFQSDLENMVRHDEVVHQIFDRQIILPVKFPQIVTLRMLRRNMLELDQEIMRVLQKVIFKQEFHLKIFLTEFSNAVVPSLYYNAVSKFIMEHSSQYQYKHYFPILTKAAKEAEFVHYTESVVNQICQKLCSSARFWRAKSFRSDRLLLDAFFWVRRHQQDTFINDVSNIKGFYPNLKITILGPYPPYNFVNIDLKHHL